MTKQYFSSSKFPALNIQGTEEEVEEQKAQYFSSSKFPALGLNNKDVPVEEDVETITGGVEPTASDKLQLGYEDIKEPADYVPTKSVTTERMVPSDEIKDLQEAQKELTQSKIKTAEELSKVTAEQEEIKAGIIQDATRKADDFEQAKQRLKAKNDAEVAKEEEYIARRRQELATTQPKNFWANKTTEDKLKMGVALFLGAIGQTLTQSKTNAAMKGLSHAITQDLDKQKSLIDRQISALGDRRLDLKTKVKRHSQLLAEFDARKAAAYDRMELLLRKAEHSTKNAQAKAVLQGKIDELNQEQADLDMAIAENAAVRVGETLTVGAETTAKEISQGQYKALIKGREGRAAPITEVVQKSMLFLDANEPNAEDMERIEQNLTPEEHKILQETMRKIVSDAQATEINIIGSAVESVLTTFEYNPEDLLEDALPGKGSDYWRAMSHFANDQTRYVSGAAVRPQEFVKEMMIYSPGLRESYANRLTGAKKRRSKLKVLREITGREEPLYFQKAR
jgi:hypothetical protein